MMNLDAIKAELETRTGAPFALFGWQQTPDLPAWGIVTQKTEAGAIWSDDEQEEQAIRGYVSLFCRERGTLPEQVQAALKALGLSWRFETSDYETDTRLLHYTWRWEDWR